MKQIFFVIIMLSLLLSNTCHEDLSLQSVELDHNLIPVWYYLKTGEHEKAEEASVSLNTYLYLMAEEYESLFQLTGSEDIYKDMESLLLHTHYLIDRGLHKEAIEQLYIASFKLSDWRSCTDNEHFIDRIWDFGRSYENTKQAVNDVELCLLEWHDFEEMVLDMNNFWGRIKSADATDYLSEIFTEKELVQYNFLIKTMDNCLEDFNENTMYADREESADFCNKIEPAYVQFVAMFGDFEPALKPLHENVDWENLLITNL